MTAWYFSLECVCDGCNIRFIWNTGDSSDCTSFFPNRVRCYSCGHVNVVDEYEDDKDSDPETAETSYPVPR